MPNFDAVLAHVYGPVLRENLLRIYDDASFFTALDGTTNEQRALVREYIRTAPILEVAKLLPDPPCG